MPWFSCIRVHYIRLRENTLGKSTIFPFPQLWICISKQFLSPLPTYTYQKIIKLKIHSGFNTFPNVDVHTILPKVFFQTRTNKHVPNITFKKQLQMLFWPWNEFSCHLIRQVEVLVTARVLHGVPVSYYIKKNVWKWHVFSLILKGWKGVRFESIELFNGKLDLISCQTY